MKTGQLRERLTLQTTVPESDGRGGWRDKWVDWAVVWGNVLTAQSDQQVDAQQKQTMITYTVIIRFRRDLPPALRLLRGGRPLYLLGPPIDEDGRRTWLRMTCEERGDPGG
jgi:SPP1 family predicted phage head-tail adaptor